MFHGCSWYNYCLAKCHSKSRYFSLVVESHVCLANVLPGTNLALMDHCNPFDRHKLVWFSPFQATLMMVEIWRDYLFNMLNIIQQLWNTLKYCNAYIVLVESWRKKQLWNPQQLASLRPNLVVIHGLVARALPCTKEDLLQRDDATPGSGTPDFQCHPCMKYGHGSGMKYESKCYDYMTMSYHIYLHIYLHDSKCTNAKCSIKHAIFTFCLGGSNFREALPFHPRIADFVRFFRFVWPDSTWVPN